MIKSGHNFKKNKVIFDLDGTLALIDKRRDVSTKSNGKLDWDKFFDPSNIKLDVPNPPVVKLAQMLAEDGFTIIIFSGRSDKTILTTKSWLARNRIPFQKLVMRDSKTNHFTPDDILKKDMLDKHVDINDVFLVVDDRDKVVKMWRSLGLNVFQVADGNF
jgi:hypothetical protein